VWGSSATTDDHHNESESITAERDGSVSVTAAAGRQLVGSNQRWSLQQFFSRSISQYAVAAVAPCDDIAAE